VHGQRPQITAPGGQIMILDLLRTISNKPANFTATAGWVLRKAICKAGWRRPGFKKIEVTVVAREEQPPHFQTVLAGRTPRSCAGI
jgi:hypothetical protein